MFERGLRAVVRVGRPVVSVGNITTGGTGKTPVVGWLVEKLIAAALRPAILLRGYKGGDEQRMLIAQLPGALVEPDPNRVDAARRVIREHPDVDVFVLDDGFQHRRIHRDFDVVLIDATNPFGFDHVLPRGLLREPLDGLARASAFLVTHAHQAAPDRLAEIERTLHQYNPGASVFRCEHQHAGFDGANPMGRKVFAFCGIGNPAAFDGQLDSSGLQRVASHWFDDHYLYSEADLSMLRDLARRSGAEVLVTTEKDWVKLSVLVERVPDLPPIARARLTIRFVDDAESRLFERVIQAIGSSPARAPSPAASTGGAPARADGAD
jgi:tetraacyldisaccharide 4'-kinase